MQPVLTRSARAILAVPLCALLALTAVFALPPAARTTAVIAAAFVLAAPLAYLLVTAVDAAFVPESAATTRVVDAAYSVGEVLVFYGPFFVVGAGLTFWAVGAFAGGPVWWHRYAGVAGGLVGLALGIGLLRGGRTGPGADTS